MQFYLKLVEEYNFNQINTALIGPTSSLFRCK